MTKSESLTFLLGNDGGDDSLLLNSPMKPNEYVPLLAMSSDMTSEEQLGALLELPILQEIMGNPLQVPSLFPDYCVQYVNVSLLCKRSSNHSKSLSRFAH